MSIGPLRLGDLLVGTGVGGGGREDVERAVEFISVNAPDGGRAGLENVVGSPGSGCGHLRTCTHTHTHTHTHTSTSLEFKAALNQCSESVFL